MRLHESDHGTLDAPRPALLFFCPGCNEPHCVIVGGSTPPVWEWNQNLEAPTFSPSILVTGQIRCHSFVRSGRVQFLPDSGHALAGQTVDLPEWSWGD